VDPGEIGPVASTEPFDHCNFSVLSDFPMEEQERWSDLLLSMSWDDPKHREMMELEGLREWLPGRTTGYAALTEATLELGYFAEEARP
jgi:ABC-type phosphate/phosphonate transport system substrate-binding protein